MSPPDPAPLYPEQPRRTGCLSVVLLLGGAFGVMAGLVLVGLAFLSPGGFEPVLLLVGAATFGLSVGGFVLHHNLEARCPYCRAPGARQAVPRRELPRELEPIARDWDWYRCRACGQSWRVQVVASGD